MKKIVIGLVLLGLAIAGGFLLTRSTATPVDSDTVVVGATIYPLYDIVRNVGGEDVTVELLLEPGTSPHTFDPSPSTIRDIQNAEVIFAIGQSLDEWVYDLAAQANNIPVVEVDKGIDVLETAGRNNKHGHDQDAEHSGEHDDEHWEDHDDDQDDEDEHSHGPADPHYWLNPENAKVIALTLAKDLGERFPENADAFMDRAEAYIQELEEKQTEWKTAFEEIEGASFVTLHDAFYYLAEFGNINLVGTFEPFPGREPTPQYLAELQKEIEEEGVQALFSEPQLSIDGIRSFASDNNIEIGILDPLGGIEGRDSYIELIDYNVHTVVETLK